VVPARPSLVRPGRADRRLTVLVVGTDDWAIDQSAQVLEATGHRVLVCHETGEPAFPCNALIEGRTCPLDVGFDLVLSARARPTPSPTQGEMGVICALHDGAPLVTVGIAEKNPFDPWAAATVGSDGNVALTVEAAAANRVFDLRRDPEATPPDGERPLTPGGQGQASGSPIG
jgi:hypothetical protein